MDRIEHPIEAQKIGIDVHLAKEILLETRICDLPATIEDTGYEIFTKKLRRELDDQNLFHVQPIFYLGDEWFCHENSACIAIPFWLADSRLRDLELEKIGFVEGAKGREFMKLLRHECGHCVDHLFGLSKKIEWQNIFGSPKQVYQPEQYSWQKKSKDYVHHLPEGYAQSHPEEDFAETFAVWLDPQSRWRTKYKDWHGALRKLEFVDFTMKELIVVKPKKLPNIKMCDQRRIRKTLRKNYSDRIRSNVITIN
jgi:hypothetical protein